MNSLFSLKNTYKYNYIGNHELLFNKSRIFVIYSSKTIPEEYFPEYEIFFRALLEENLVYGGGWHSPFEKRIFSIWNEKQTCALIYFAGRQLDNEDKNIIKQFQNIPETNYLIIDPLIKSKRITRKTVIQRDEFIQSIVTNYIFTYIKPGGYCEKLLLSLVDSGKNVFLLNHSSNEPYFNDAITRIDSFSLDLLKCI